jgi:hypothetical protein
MDTFAQSTSPTTANRGGADTLPPLAPVHSPWGAGRRGLVSLLVALHMAAVYFGPLAVPPSSDVAVAGRAVLRPYIDATYLDNGYRFFNEPGPSHRMRYLLEFDDGRAALAGYFPDKQAHWPRLRYHRHFMLTEFHAAHGFPADPPPDAQPGTPAYAEWRKLRETAGKLGDVYLESYARHLLAESGAQRLTLWGVERELPSMEDVRSGVPVTDARYLREVLLGNWEVRR